MALFEYGTAVPNAATGMLAANIQTFVRAHGWNIEPVIDDNSICFHVSAVTIGPSA